MIINAKQPGRENEITPISMEFCNNCLGESAEAYESLLYVAIAGDQTLPLERLVRPCRVLDLTEVSEGITRADLAKWEIEAGEFLLLQTKNSLQEAFDFAFVYLTEEGAQYLVEKQVHGVGIDALGIERAQPGHPTHKHLFRANIIIIEGLRLKEVPAGQYFMVAAPIKLVHTEAAPARVLLLEGMGGGS
jgi:arylformamidase